MWQGFYMELERNLDEGDWGYVANPSGGFWGYWWHWCQISSDSTIELYLQFEQDKLCIKAYSKAETRPKLSWTNQIVEISKEKGLIIDPPTKRRIGKTMTLAIVKSEEIFQSIVPDIEPVIKKLKEIEVFVTEVSSKI